MRRGANGGTLTLIANISDMQTGSTKALFPNENWHGIHQMHDPTEEQAKIYKHWIYCADILKQRGNRKLIIINSGDAIDGDHHGSHELITRIIHERVTIHENLMLEFMERANFSFQNGDKLIYIQGTEVHTGEEEIKIAADLGAEISSHVEIKIDGNLLWFVHKGPRAGKGANKGNSLRNNLRDIYWECLDYGEPIPDLISYAHVHVPDYETFEGRRKTIHGYINPSWQTKTRFINGVAPVERTRIGMTTFQIIDGIIYKPYFHLLNMSSAKSVIMQETKQGE